MARRLGAGHIPSGTNRSAIGAWVIALLWNSISAPGLVFIASVWKQNRAAAAVFLIFPLIGISLLYRAIRLTIAARKFGTSDFVMASTPGVIGGKLRGSIQAGFDPISERSVTLKLTCIHRTASGSGVVQPTNAGGLEFVFPAARNPALAAGFTLIFLIFSVALYYLLVYSRSIYIGFLFSVACAVLLFVVTMFWFLRQRVTIENGSVTIRSSVLGIARTQQIPCAGISDLKLNIGVQSGRGSGTPYYYIQFMCRDGRKRTAGRQIRNKREAVWVMNQMKKAIGTFSPP